MAFDSGSRTKSTTPAKTGPFMILSWLTNLRLGLIRVHRNSAVLFSPLAKSLFPERKLRLRRHPVGRFVSVSADECRLSTKLERLEDRNLLSAVHWVGNGDGHSWANAANWSTGVIPAITDDVTINAVVGTVIQGPTVNTTINSLDLQSGTLTLSAMYSDN